MGIYWSMKKIFKRLVFLLAALVLLQIWCGQTIRQELWVVKSSQLPEAFEDLRITLLTDIHGKAFGKDSEKLIAAVAQAQPDLIAISGDIVDRYSTTDNLRSLLTGLVKLAPVFYVTGNHEWDRDDTEQVLKIIRDCGVSVLRNEFVTMKQDGQTMVIAGAEDPNGYADQMTPEELVEDVRGELGDPYILMLYHRNDSLELWSQLGVDLVLAGHGHGGVIRLPVVGGLLGVDRKLFPKDCEGLYQNGRTTLAVSCGLAGVRLWNRPHLPTLILECE